MTITSSGGRAQQRIDRDCDPQARVWINDPHKRTSDPMRFALLRWLIKATADFYGEDFESVRGWKSPGYEKERLSVLLKAEDLYAQARQIMTPTMVDAWNAAFAKEDVAIAVEIEALS